MITAAVLAFAHIGGLLVERRSMMICQAELAEGQRQAGDAIEKILALNPRIQTMKALKLQGEILMLNPYTALLGERMRTVAISFLNMLMGLRRLYIAKGILDQRSAMMRAERLLRQEWREQHQAQSAALLNIQGRVQGRSPPKLAVRPVNADDEYPEYELMSAFSWLQTQSLSWKTAYGLTKENHVWSQMAWSKSQDCQVTLEERERGGEKLRVRLNTGRFFSRPWF